MKRDTIANKLNQLAAAGEKRYSYAFTAGLFESMLSEALVNMTDEQQQKFMEMMVDPILKSITNTKTETRGTTARVDETKFLRV
jgi:hypothetical protein